MRAKETITLDLTSARSRLILYLNREAEMLGDGVQSYGVGSKNLTRYNTDLSIIRDAIAQLKQEITDLTSELVGGKPRRAFSVVIRDS